MNPKRIIVGNYAKPMGTRNGILVYMSHEAGDWDVYVMSLEGGNPTNLTDNNFADGLPTISPDGNMIAYISDQSGGWGLWTMDIDGANKRHWFDIDPGRGTIDIDKWSQERMSWRR